MKFDIRTEKIYTATFDASTLCVLLNVVTLGVERLKELQEEVPAPYSYEVLDDAIKISDKLQCYWESKGE